LNYARTCAKLSCFFAVILPVWRVERGSCSMSSTVAKNYKKSGGRQSSPPSRKRLATSKTTRLKPATKRSPAGKAPARKATKLQSRKQRVRATARTAKPSGKKVQRKSPPKPIIPRVPGKAQSAEKRRAAITVAPIKPPPPAPKPTYDEAAAIKAFEAAHKEFTRGRFAEARNQFRVLIDKYSSVVEVSARARTYLSIAEARLRTELTSPRDADSLYDRGVIELNRGEYVAAQELFERALKREPDAAHIHYGLAASRARLGAIDTALKSLRRALDLQPKLRIRAQRDHDLNPLRSDPEFDQLVFARE
jgi:tetratricopeptide (TPR) repeat protein